MRINLIPNSRFVILNVSDQLVSVLLQKLLFVFDVISKQLVYR